MYTSNKISLKNKSLSDIFFYLSNYISAVRRRYTVFSAMKDFGNLFQVLVLSVSGSGNNLIRFW